MSTAVLQTPRRAKSRRKPSRTKARPVSDEQLLEWFQPSALQWGNIHWTVLIWISAMHLGCLAAPFFVTWPAIGAAVVLHWMTACLGVTLGYHRFLSHRGFKLVMPARFFIFLCGCLSAEGTPLRWAAIHRMHHAKSDQPGDPHSPRDGNWWSHMLWLFVRRTSKQDELLYRRFVPDLMHDPMLRFFDQTFILWSFALAVLLYAIGGWPFVVWGMCVRMTVVYHCTWFVNSVTHLWGYRSYPTKDDSKNLWWVALLTYGEGWHNNHHAFPRLARSGHRWWEIDMTFWVIRALQRLGLAYEVHDRIPAPRTA